MWKPFASCDSLRKAGLTSRCNELNGRRQTSLREKEIFRLISCEAMSADFSDALLYKCLTTDTWDTDGSLGHRLQSSSNDDSRSSLASTANLCSEEQMLDRAFQECDSEANGKVSVLQIIEYLKSLTDPSRDGERLQHLQKMFDPNDQGILVDFQTFRSVMSQWIASCCSDRNRSVLLEDDIFDKDLEQQDSDKQFYGSAQVEENVGHLQSGEKTELMSKITDLTFTNKNLTDLKSKMQKNLELAEETNTELTEELAKVKGLLKSSQHALHQTLSVQSELEDLKIFSKDLENRINSLCAQKKELEKEILKLSSQKQSLQEENDKLLTEKEKTQERLDDSCTENSNLLQQLYEYESLLLEKEDSLAHKNLQLKELQALVEEYKSLSEELKREKHGLEEQLSKTHEDLAMSQQHLVPRNTQLIPYYKQNTIHQRDARTLAWSFTDFLTLQSLIWLKTHLTGYSRHSRILLLVFLCSFWFISAQTGEHIWTVIVGILQAHIQLHYLTMPPF